MAGYGLGLFFGGMQEGIKDRREYELNLKKDARADEELTLNKKKVGLAAAELAQRRSEFDQRLAFDKTKEANDVSLRGKGLSLQEKSVLLQEQAQKNAQEREFASRADQVITGLMGVAKQTIDAARATGKSSEDALTAVSPLLDKVKGLADKTGLNGDLYLNQARAYASQPTPTEMAAAKGQVVATEKLSETASLVGGGVKPESAALTSGIKVDQKNLDLRTFTFPDGSRSSVRADDAAAINAAVARGGISTPMSVQASKAGDLSVSGPDDKEIANARKNLRETQSNINELMRTVDQFKKNPAAAGVVGHLVEKMGGLAKQIPIVGPAAVKAAEGITGISTAEVIKTRTDAVAAIGQVIRLISQDNSRFSEGDRKLAERASKALDPNAAWDDVVAAFTELTDVMKRTDRTDSADVLRVGAKIDVKDLHTDAGIQKFTKILLGNGLSEYQAFEAIQNIIDRNKLK